MPELLTEDQFAMIWAGDTASLANVDVTTEEKKTDDSSTVVEEKKDKSNTAAPINEEDLNNIFVESTGDEDDEDEEEEEVVTQDTKEDSKKDKAEGGQEQKKAGRKPTDLIALVSQMVEEELLDPYEDGQIKTIEEAKELIKLNLQKREEISEEKFWEHKMSSYSPQVQALIHYAEQGGTNIVPLMEAISRVEEISELSPDTEKNQEEIVRQVLRMKNFDNDEIEDQISTLKDLDKLKAKAEKFLPELRTTKEQQVRRMMQEEAQRKAEAEEATRIYLTTVQNTLSKENVKGVKLQREDKAKIYEALAVPRHTSLNGERTNGFVKALEEMQFGKNADYEQFLNIVHMAVDPEGFREKMRESLKNELTAETVKKIKTSRSTNANTEENYESKLTKKTIARSEFKNPFA